MSFKLFDGRGGGEACLCPRLAVCLQAFDAPLYLYYIYMVLITAPPSPKIKTLSARIVVTGTGSRLGNNAFLAFRDDLQSLIDLARSAEVLARRGAALGSGDGGYGWGGVGDYL